MVVRFPWPIAAMRSIQASRGAKGSKASALRAAVGAGEPERVIGRKVGDRQVGAEQERPAILQHVGQEGDLGRDALPVRAAGRAQTRPWRSRAS